ncbi:MAG: hypothetical protein WCP73_04475 [Eubacteriales bacterium]
MKKIIYMLLICFTIISLLGCTGNGPQATQPAASPTQAAPSSAASPAASATAAVSASLSPSASATLSLHPSSSPSASASNSGLLYQNAEYGFSFSLPSSWKGYTIVDLKWEGSSLDNKCQNQVSQTGPELKIRHPKWTTQNPREDIPIMIFTLAQWTDLQADKFHIGAAPINPTELARNSTYVFALPARYNFDALTGYEEVADILKTNPLHPSEEIGEVS